MQRDNKNVEKFYKSRTWERTRKAFFIFRNGLCERCYKNNRMVRGDIVHHKIYITADNVDVYEIALDFNNLELLCQTCHNQEHHRQDSVEFDDNGDMVPPSSLGNIKVAGTEVGSFEKCKLKAQDGVVREVK